MATEKTPFLDLCERHEVDAPDLFLKIQMALEENDYSDAPKIQFSRGELHVIYASLEVAGEF